MRYWRRLLARCERHFEDQRYVQGRVVQEDAVGLLFVFTKALAVVACHHDERAVIVVVLLDEVEQVRDCGIGVGDFAIVGMILELRGERLGWFVGIVRVIQMHPEEARTAGFGGGMRSEPCFSVGDHFIGAAFHAAKARGGFAVFADRRSVCGKVVVKVEAAIEAGGKRGTVENHGAYEGGSLVPLRLEQLSQCGVASKRNAEVGNAVRARQQSGEDAGMRSVGDGAGGEGLGKTDAVGVERVERGGLGQRVAVAADVIGAQGVYSDEDDVRPSGLKGLFDCEGWGGGTRRMRQQTQNDERNPAAQVGGQIERAGWHQSYNRCSQGIILGHFLYLVGSRVRWLSTFSGQSLLICTAMIALAASAAAAAPTLLAEPRAQQPNVLFLTIDTLRADHVGCYGYKGGRTPAMDALAADGFRFADAVTPVPITLPSHTVMFTGTFPMYSGMHDFSANVLNAEQPTLASVLKDHDYATGAVVAAAVLDSRFGLNRGFDFYYDHFDFSRLQESNLDEMERPGNLVADRTLEWLAANAALDARKRPAKPFFFWMHLYDPHAPYRPPEPYASQFKNALYDGEIAFADAQVGRVIAWLKQHKLYDNTLIVLSGDHGEGLGDHGEQTHGFFIYRSTLHVPLIMKLPGAGAAKNNEKPEVVETSVSTVDLMPTILGALALPIPGQVQGHSLLPLLVAHEAKGANPTAATTTSSLYAETFLPRLHFNWSELRGLQQGRFHFIEAPKPELYDIAADPGELHNLFGEKKAVGGELRVQLQKVIHDYTPGQDLAQKVGLDPALAERLKSLGYAAFSGGGDANAKASDLPDPKDRLRVYDLVSSAMDDSQHARYEPAASKLQEALAAEPDSVPANYLLGLNYYRLRDFESATTRFQHVLKLSPDYALAVYNLGLAQARSGHLEDAVTTLKRALAVDATNFSAAYNLGAAYLQLHQVAEAEAAFRQSVEVYPGYAAGHRALGEIFLYQQKVAEALAELRRAVELAPEDGANHASLAKVLAASGENVEAEQEMQRAQRLRRQ